MRMSRRGPWRDLTALVVLSALVSMLLVQPLTIRPAHAFSIGPGMIISLATWAAEFFRDQHQRIEDHKPAGMLRVRVPEEHRRTGDPYAITTEYLSTDPSGPGYTYHILRDDGPNGRLWQTYVRVFPVHSGHKIEWAALYKGQRLITKLEGKEWQNREYFDFELPPELGYGTGGEERHLGDKYEVVFFMPGNEEERSSFYFFVKAMSISDFREKYRAEVENQVGRRIAESDRQLHPERTAQIEVQIDSRLGAVGLTVMDSLGHESGAKPGDRSTLAFSEPNVAPGRHVYNVRPGPVWVMLDRPYNLLPRPNSPGFYYVIQPGGRLVVQAVPKEVK